jgi:hypothetical protein
MSDACEMPLKNATTAELREMLATAKRIAVVGLSDKPERDSFQGDGFSANSTCRPEGERFRAVTVP